MDTIPESHVLKLVYTQAQHTELPLLHGIYPDIVVVTNKKSFGDPCLDRTRLVDIDIDNYGSASLSLKEKKVQVTDFSRA